MKTLTLLSFILGTASLLSPATLAAHLPVPATVDHVPRGASVTVVTDICTVIDIGIPPLLHIDICACVSTVTQITSSLSRRGKNDLPAYLGPLRTWAKTAKPNGRGNKQCQRPLNSKAACSTTNICNWECEDGYQKSPDGKSCVPKPCPSTRKPQRRSLDCPSGLTPCGVYGRGNRAWECIDTTRDLESCGGCTTPLFPGYQNSAPTGVDCTAIPNVDSVACVQGSCQVTKCAPGYVVSPQGSSCAKVHGPEYSLPRENRVFLGPSSATP